VSAEPQSASKVQVAREMTEAWRRADVERLLELTAPEFEFISMMYAAVEPKAASVRGADAFREFFADLHDTWETFEVEPHEFREVGDHVFAESHLRAKGRGSGVELDQPLFTCFWFGEDGLVRSQSFLDEDAALAAISERAEA
jgi:ketosteroid isomerase-like protein